MTRPSWLVPVGYLLLSCLLAQGLLSDPAHSTLAGGRSDLGLLVWFMGHTSTAVLHHGGHGLLFTDALNAPTGVNLMWNCCLLLPGLLLVPVTALGGPVLSLNVLVVLGPALAAWSAYLCSRRFLTRTDARVVTGLVFGFSPAIVAASRGHLQLTLLALVPPMLLLVTDLATGRGRPVVRGGLLGLLAACQLLTGEEVLALTAVVAAVLLLVLAVQRPHEVVGRLVPMAQGLGAAAGAFLVVAGYPLWIQLHGAQQTNGPAQAPDTYVLDPSELLLGSRQALDLLPLNGLFGWTPSNASEALGFLGVPVLVLLTAVVWHRRRDVVARTTAITAVAVMLLALGPTLHLAGTRTGFPLPWGVLDGAPLASSLLPVRWMLLVDLLVALLVGLAIESLPAGGTRRWVAAGWVGLCLLTLVPAPLPGIAPTRTPAFFTSGHLRGTVLIVPMSGGGDARAMLWQAESGADVRLPGGFFLGPGPHHRPATGAFPSRLLQRRLFAVGSGRAVAVNDTVRAQSREDLAYWGVGTVVLGPTDHEDELRQFLTAVLGREPEGTGGVWLWRV